MIFCQSKKQFDVLEILLNNKDEYISGEDISKILGITRAAVWKHIRFFRGEGYKVESKSKKGYRLAFSPDRLFPPEIRYGLDTQVFGKNIFYYETVDSTNDVLNKIAAQSCSEGTVLLSEQQTAGKGRLGRKWLSPKYKGIWMSLVLRPPVTISQVSKITLIIAVCVARAIEKYVDKQVKIKWPNDIIIEGKKVCGILAELSGEVDRVNYVIVGIGINVDFKNKDFPLELQSKATSLSDFALGKISRSDIVKDILLYIEEYYLRYIQDGNFNKILEIYKEKSSVLGKRIRVLSPTDGFEGKAIDLTKEGSLIVLKDDGDVETVCSGEVSIRGLL